MGVGYAFLNFRTAEACQRFAAEFHNKDSCEKLPGFKSKKVCEVAAATCQGCKKNIGRLQNSPVMTQLVAKPEWLPRLFDAAGERIEFPVLDGNAGSGWHEEPSSPQKRRGKGQTGKK